MNQKYNVKAKVNGKFWSFGNVQPGQYGPRLGLKATPELKRMVTEAADGTWINFSMFEDDGQREQRPAPQSSYSDDVGF